MTNIYKLKTGEHVDLENIVHIGKLEWEVAYPLGYKFEITFKFVNVRVNVFTKAPRRWKALDEDEKIKFKVLCEDSYNSLIEAWKEFKKGNSGEKE